MLSAEHAQQSLQLLAQHNDPDLFTNMSKRRLATVSLCRILVKLGEQRARLIGFVTSRVSPEQIQRGPSKTTKILAAKSDKRTRRGLHRRCGSNSRTFPTRISRHSCHASAVRQTLASSSSKLFGSAWRFWTAENSSRCSNDGNVVTRLKFHEGDDMYFATTNDAGVIRTAIAGTTTHSGVDALKDLTFRPRELALHCPAGSTCCFGTRFGCVPGSCRWQCGKGFSHNTATRSQPPDSLRKVRRIQLLRG